MLALLLNALLSTAGYPSNSVGDYFAGSDGLAICETVQKLRDLKSAFDENDDARADAAGCTVVPEGSKIEIVLETAEPLLAGSAIVKVRGSTEYGQTVEGYASRGAIVDKK